MYIREREPYWPWMWSRNRSKLVFCSSSRTIGSVLFFPSTAMLELHSITNCKHILEKCWVYDKEIVMQLVKHIFDLGCLYIKLQVVSRNNLWAIFLATPSFCQCNSSLSCHLATAHVLGYSPFHILPRKWCCMWVQGVSLVGWWKTDLPRMRPRYQQAPSGWNHCLQVYVHPLLSRPSCLHLCLCQIRHLDCVHPLRFPVQHSLPFDIFSNLTESNLKPGHSLLTQIAKAWAEAIATFGLQKPKVTALPCMTSGTHKVL